MFKKKYLCLAIMAISVDALSNTNDSAMNDISMPWGRAQISAAGVTNSLGVFGGDAMIPVFGNKDGFAYADIMGDYGTDATYVVSPGAGFRQTYNNQILGAYLFADYAKTSLSENFWTISPGVEWMSPHWDARANGYIPTETTKQNGTTDYLNTFGDSSQVSFETGTHNQYDELVTPSAVIGSGVDAEVGYSFASRNDLRTRVYLGGYYYQPPSDADVDNIPGVTAGFEQPLTKNIKLSIYNSYDQVSEYNAGVSLTFALGGESNVYSNDVHTRLLDPIDRHIGVIDTGAGTYDQQTLDSQGTSLEYDNVYFVSTTGSNSNDGTYGSAMLLDQTSVDAIEADSPDSSRIYIQGGTDSSYTIDSSTGSSETVDSTTVSGIFAHDGQSFYGRSADYTTAAATSEQPQILVDGASGYNGFIFTEGGENTISDLNITSSSAGSNSGIIVGIRDDEEGTLNVYNTSISQFSSGLTAGNYTANTLVVNVDNSQLNNNSQTMTDADAYGMLVYNGSSGDLTVNATNSEFNNNIATGDSARAAGLFGINNGSGNLTINTSNSQFDGNTAIGTSADSAGMWVNNTLTGTLNVNINNSLFNENSVTGDNAIATGLYVFNNSTNDVRVAVASSQFNSNTANGSSSAKVFGVDLVNSNSSAGDIYFIANDSQFSNNTNNDGSVGVGLYAYNGSSGDLTIKATNSEFNNNTSDGMFVVNKSTTGGTLSVASLSGSTFYDNGRYGIYAKDTTSGYNTTVNYSGASFSGNQQNIGTNGDVTLVHTP